MHFNRYYTLTSKHAAWAVAVLDAPTDYYGMCRLSHSRFS